LFIKKTTIRRNGLVRLKFLPILVWLAALAGAVVMFYQRSESFQIVGVARSEQCNIAATVPGRIKSLPVQLFQQVSQYDTIAVLDDKMLQAQLATAKSEIERLRAELSTERDRMEAEKDQRQTDMVSTQRRFAVDVENARLRTLELLAAIEPDRIMLDSLQAEIDIEKKLLEKDIIDTDYALSKANANYNALAKRIQNQQKELDQADLSLGQARQRFDEFAKMQPMHTSIANALNVLRQGITVQERRMKELSVQREALVLSCPFDGVVSQIFRREGEAVVSAEAIVTIAQNRASEVIAYIETGRHGIIRQGINVEIIKNSQPPQIISSQISSVGPVVEQMPQQLWPSSTMPQWGRPFRIPLPENSELKLVSGEIVGVRGI